MLGAEDLEGFAVGFAARFRHTNPEAARQVLAREGVGIGRDFPG